MKCPPFLLAGIDQTGEEKNYSLESFTEYDQIILYFYPKDNTPGCTTQAQDFTALQEKFSEKNIKIIGVSPDSIKAHSNFIEKKELSLLLLSDPEKKLIEPIDAWGEKTNYGKKYFGLIRSTFLIDPKSGEIIESWKNVRAKGHVQRVCTALNLD
jgi:peroxiredoxin Q/BCP